jgi:hypothetical protein
MYEVQYTDFSEREIVRSDPISICKQININQVEAHHRPHPAHLVEFLGRFDSLRLQGFHKIVHKTF